MKRTFLTYTVTSLALCIGATGSFAGSVSNKQYPSWTNGKHVADGPYGQVVTLIPRAYAAATRGQSRSRQRLTSWALCETPGQLGDPGGQWEGYPGWRWTGDPRWQWDGYPRWLWHG